MRSGIVVISKSSDVFDHSEFVALSAISVGGWFEDVELKRIAAGPMAAGVMRQFAFPDKVDFNCPRLTGERSDWGRKVEICKIPVNFNVFGPSSHGGRTDRVDRDMAAIR
jgi:hypothetical protein